MSNFKQFKLIVNKHLDKLITMGLFITTTNKDLLWETYLESFKPEHNPIYKERSEHDCQCCKQFIRNIGTVVAVNKLNQLISIWDITVPTEYQASVDAMATLVKSNLIENGYFHFEGMVGTDYNHQQLEDGSIKKWEHFHYDLPALYVSKDPGTTLGLIKTTKELFKRGLDTLTQESAEIVLELIDQKSLYRGDEYRKAVSNFLKESIAYNSIQEDRKDNYCWIRSKELGMNARFKNTVIGTLLEDLSEGKELDHAVKSFETKVAPSNYKRSSALITKGMKEAAEITAVELGIMDSLPRRCAVIEDITVNNVIYADKSVRKQMNAFDTVLDTVIDKVPNLDKIEEVSLETFLKDIVPKSTSIEVMLENKHTSNLMSLVAPVNSNAPNMLNWGNNFSWAYNGDITDSMKERVKSAGGRVDGVFRFTHSWNRLEPNKSLMDLHVFMPGSTQSQGNIHDNYGNDTRVGWNHRKHYPSGGIQDVDYTEQAPIDYIPIENITFPILSRMPEGDYLCKIHNWSFRHSGGRGEAEIEINNTIYQYEYPRTKHKEWITVAKVNLKNNEFTINHNLPHGQSSKEIWDLPTQKFHKVNMIMNSPNHWDGEDVGNKHLFFILDKCKNPEPVRGFFNEFLMNDLIKHRKVFEILGSKMKAEPSDNQLSGLGFSSTQRNQLICKVTGAFTRTIKINL